MINGNVVAIDLTSLFGDNTMTVLVGLMVAFLVLLVITWAVMLSGRANGAKRCSQETETAGLPATPVSGQPPVVQNGISDEVVAAIAAAVAMMSADGKTYAIRRISRASNGRSAWAAAGIAENTRSF